MRAIAIVGRPKAGKTHLAKEQIAAIREANPRLPLLVYDTNNEWTPGLPLPDIDDYLKRCVNTPGRALMVIEDATVFFHVTGHSALLKKLLIGRRHANGKTIFLLFHSLRQIPLYIMDVLDAVVLLRTNDSRAKIETRFEQFPALADAFDEVRAKVQAGEKHPHVYVELQ